MLQGQKHSIETKQKMSEAHKGITPWWLKGKHLSIEHKQKLSEATKGRRLPPRTNEHSRNISIALTGHPNHHGKLKIRGSLAKGTIENPIVGDIRWGDEIGKANNYRYMFVKCPDCNATRWSEYRTSGKSNKSVRRCTHCTGILLGLKSKELWSSLEFKEEMIRKLRYECGTVRPTKPEQIIGAILDEICPSEYEYTGDGAIVINGMVPDFTNTNGQKKVIEVFGDYWHSSEKVRTWKETELGRIMAYNYYGFSCLVIWEYETENKELVKARIKEFNNENIHAYSHR